jgi:hypothetical protein
MRLALVTVTALCALFVVLWSTGRNGIGESPDSISYIDGAKSIHAALFGGNREAQHRLPWIQRIYPDVHFPPLYPAMLSVPLFMGVDIFEGARWLNAIIFLLTALTIGVTTWACTKKSLLPAAASIALFLFSTGMIQLYTYALSEPAFNLFALLACLFLAGHLYRPNWRLLAASSIALAMALLTRYAGIFLLVPMILALLCLQRSSLGVRLKACALLLLAGLSPLVLWCLRNYWMAHSATGRPLAMHLIDPIFLRQFAATLSDFWFPLPLREFIRFPLLLIGCLLALVVFIPMMRRASRSAPTFKEVLLPLIGLFMVFDVFFLIVSISIADAYTPLDYRILSPILIFGVVFVSAVFGSRGAVGVRRFVRPGYMVFVLIITCFNIGRATPLMIKMHGEGIGYASSSWRNSAAMAYIRSLPDSIPVFSNCPDGILFLTGRKSRFIPRMISTYTRNPNPDFAREIAWLHNRVVRNGAVIVYFNAASWRYYLPTLQDMRDSYRFPVLAELNDGTVFGVAGNGDSAIKR